VRHTLAAVGLFVACVIVAGHASADDAPIAEALYGEGQKLIAEGRIHEACMKFAESERVDPAAGTLVASAACHEKEGRVATAWAEFKEATVSAQRAREPARERYARAHADQLAGALYRVAIDLPDAPPGVEVKVDTRALGVGALGSAIPLDPGTHHFEVSAPGRITWVKDVDVPTGGGGQRVTAALAIAPVPPPPVVVLPAPKVAPVAAIAVGAVGAGAIVVGAVVLAVASFDGSAAKTEASNANTMQSASGYSTAQLDRSHALTLQAVGLGVGAAGILAAGVAVGWIVRSRYVTPRAASDAGFRLSPSFIVVPGRGGNVGLSATF
jgi:hypothetical protein